MIEENLYNAVDMRRYAKTTKETSAYTEPDPRSLAFSIIPAGANFPIESVSGEMYKIKFSNGATPPVYSYGYVRKSDTALLPPGVKPPVSLPNAQAGRASGQGKKPGTAGSGAGAGNAGSGAGNAGSGAGAGNAGSGAGNAGSGAGAGSGGSEESGTQAAVPWYKNMKIVIPAGLGLLVVGYFVFKTKHKKA